MMVVGLVVMGVCGQAWGASQKNAWKQKQFRNLVNQQKVVQNAAQAVAAEGALTKFREIHERSKKKKEKFQTFKTLAEQSHYNQTFIPFRSDEKIGVAEIKKEDLDTDQKVTLKDRAMVKFGYVDDKNDAGGSIPKGRLKRVVIADAQAKLKESKAGGAGAPGVDKSWTTKDWLLVGSLFLDAGGGAAGVTHLVTHDGNGEGQSPSGLYPVLPPPEPGVPPGEDKPVESKLVDLLKIFSELATILEKDYPELAQKLREVVDQHSPGQTGAGQTASSEGRGAGGGLEAQAIEAAG